MALGSSPGDRYRPSHGRAVIGTGIVIDRRDSDRVDSDGWGLDRGSPDLDRFRGDDAKRRSAHVVNASRRA